MPKAFLLFPVLLTLLACQQKPETPTTVIQQVYCVTPKQYSDLKDAEPGKIGNSLPSDARDANKALVGQNILVRQYADGLLTVLGGCIGPEPFNS